MSKASPDLFKLSGKVAVITGGAGMLGVMHAEAIAEAGGTPVLIDIRADAVQTAAADIQNRYGVGARGYAGDITRREEVKRVFSAILKDCGRIDILINNAAYDPKVKEGSKATAGDDSNWARFENYSLDLWNRDLAVGLTGAFLCSQVFGAHMATAGAGIILNISSDLGVIAPDQRIYMKQDVAADQQPVKSVTYSVVKTGLIGLTRFLATYWADRGVRVNALCPGGVEAGQPEDFMTKLAFRIPLGRMAKQDEYKGAIVFLVSDASSYMTGTTLVMDGGRSCW